MSDSDLSEILSIEKESFSVPWTQALFEQEIDKQYAFVMENDHKISGYICGWKIADEFHITNIAVRKEFQRKRIGQQLLDFIRKVIDKSEFSYIILEVRENNIRARNFYKKNYFDEIGERKNYYSNPKENAIIMLLKL